MKKILVFFLLLPIRATSFGLALVVNALDELTSWVSGGDKPQPSRREPHIILADGTVLTREMMLEAGRDIGSVVVKITDETPNREQLVQIVSGTWHAAHALAGMEIMREHSMVVKSTMFEGIISVWNQAQMRPGENFGKVSGGE